MRRMKRFLQLSKAERVILLQAVLLLILVRFALRWLSLSRVQKLVGRAARHSKRVCAAHRIAWAIQTAARFIPGATCLTQALAAQALLTRHGYNPSLTIGVMKDEQRGFEAHAWLTCHEQILVGGPEVGRYTSLLNLESQS
jgi:hypothetical protein